MRSMTASRFEELLALLRPPMKVVGTVRFGKLAAVTTRCEMTFMPAPVSTAKRYGPPPLIQTSSKSPRSLSTRNFAGPGLTTAAFTLPVALVPRKWAAPSSGTAHTIAARAPDAMKSFALMPGTPLLVVSNGCRVYESCKCTEPSHRHRRVLQSLHLSYHQSAHRRPHHRRRPWQPSAYRGASARSCVSAAAGSRSKPDAMTHARCGYWRDRCFCKPPEVQGLHMKWRPHALQPRQPQPL